MLTHEQLLERVESLPPLPAATAQLAGLINDPTAGAPAFVAVIKPDIALTTNVLRLCNSAYFGLSHTISSIRQAITLMGTKRIFELAMGSSFAKMLGDKIVGYDMDSRAYWLHSVAVGVLTERLASSVPNGVPDMAFISGLLHDIGKLAIGVYLDGNDSELLEQINAQEQPLITVEKEILGACHAELGAEVAAHWQLPEGIGWGIRWHHDIALAPPEADRVLIDLVHTADGLAHALGMSAGMGEVTRTISPEVVSRLKLTPDYVRDVGRESMNEIIDLSKMLMADG